MQLNYFEDFDTSTLIAGRVRAIKNTDLRFIPVGSAPQCETIVLVMRRFPVYPPSQFENSENLNVGLKLKKFEYAPMYISKAAEFDRFVTKVISEELPGEEIQTIPLAKTNAETDEVSMSVKLPLAYKKDVFQWELYDANRDILFPKKSNQSQQLKGKKLKVVIEGCFPQNCDLYCMAQCAGITIAEGKATLTFKLLQGQILEETPAIVLSGVFMLPECKKRLRVDLDEDLNET